MFTREATVDQINIVTSGNSTAQQVYAWLHGRILRGELEPVARLSETEIAHQAGVSRQPVREAFIRLTATGLAEVRPQRGTFIDRISIKAVLSARLIREAVESDLIRMVSAHPGDALLDQLDEQLAAQRDASEKQDVEAFIALDDRFHHSLAVAAGHGDVWDVLEGLKSQMNRLRYITARVFDHQKLIEQHGAIVQALREGDTDAAEQAMRLHLREVLNDLPEIAAAKPEFFTE
ncbi:GntR family transcriptional regulator [Paracoccus saliphilus]|uniref:GntR family transcriptional regulator n=1 Tax=Paracoccus saliphilus TaxID=405559 RepID=A0ABY7S6Y6_9RHOB|nr:GntR family transcriptional regulator [Paracoccus saliphilus]